MTQKERELRAKIAELNAKGGVIASAESRTPEQLKELESITAELNETAILLASEIASSNAKRTMQGNPLPKSEDNKWKDFSEFLLAVRAAKVNSRVDERLIIKDAASGANQGTDADGGYLINKDFLINLLASVYEESIIFGDTMNIGVKDGSNGITLRMPKEGFSDVGENTGVGVFGGALAYWIDEANKIDISKIGFEKLDLKLKKVAALMFATGEMEQDFSAIASFTEQSAGTAIAYSIDEAIIRGETAKNQPLGIMNSPALETVAPASQASAIILDDILKMWGSMRQRDRVGAKWYINQDIETELMKLKIGEVAVYIPAGTIANVPYAMLLGRPVVPIENASTLGEKGDIIFANFGRYLTITKGGIRSDVSIHVAFDTDQVAWRFIVRIDGAPLRSSKYKRSKGKGTYSPFVTLGARTLGA